MKRLVLITLLVVELVILSDCCSAGGREKSGKGADKSEVSNSHNKIPVGTPPEGMELNPFYKKYLDCEGIAVISSERVDDRAFYQVKKLFL